MNIYGYTGRELDGLRKSGNISLLNSRAVSPNALRQNLTDSYSNPLLNNRFYNISGISSISSTTGGKL